MKKMLLTALCVSTLSVSPAFASPKPWIFSWEFGHFANLDFTKRYLNNGKDVHDRQWEHKKWNPDVWIEQKKSGLELINGFYQSNILENQRVKRGIPYLHVGAHFHKLSGYEQRRVVQSVDEVYQITNLETDDIFYIYDECRGEVIGMYTKYGLQLH